MAGEDDAESQAIAASRGLSNAAFRAVGHQSTVTRKPNRVERPQAALVEAGNFIEPSFCGFSFQSEPPLPFWNPKPEQSLPYKIRG